MNSKLKILAARRRCDHGRAPLAAETSQVTRPTARSSSHDADGVPAGKSRRDLKRRSHRRYARAPRRHPQAIECLFRGLDVMTASQGQLQASSRRRSEGRPTQPPHGIGGAADWPNDRPAPARLSPLPARLRHSPHQGCAHWRRGIRQRQEGAFIKQSPAATSAGCGGASLGLAATPSSRRFRPRACHAGDREAGEDL